MAGTLLIANTPPSFAQNSTKGCATDTWTAMTNQAALESRREDLFNKRYIVKADSVLQYSCFQDEALNTLNNIGPIFSNGDQWVNREVPFLLGATSTTIDIYNASPTRLHQATDSPNYYELEEGSGFDYKKGYVFPLLLPPVSLEGALILTVQESFENYLIESFSHAPIAGTTPLNTFDTCYNMGQIWQAAKCKNFDGPQIFSTLDELVNFDPREFPSNMRCAL